MCGHIGFFTTETTYSLDRKKIFQQGLFVDTLRGDDSTGIALLKHKKPTIYKKALAGYDFINSRQFDKVFDKSFVGATIGIGHNRAATKGYLNDDNSHPFHYGNIILAHNGTLTYSHWNKPKNYDTFAVDSEFICHSFSDIGVEKTLALLEGSFALVWIDLSDRSLNLVRNSQRELYFAHLEDEETTIYGSEGDMLTWLASRNNVKIKDDKIWELSPAHWIKFTNKSHIKYTAKEVSLYKYTNTYNSRSSRDAGNIAVGDAPEKWLNRCLYFLNEEVRFSPRQIRPSFYEATGKILESTLSNTDIEGAVYGKDFKFVQDNGIHKKYTGDIKRVFTKSDYVTGPKTLVIVLENVKLYTESISLPNKQDETIIEDGEGDTNTLYCGPGGSKLTEKELDDLFRETGCRCCGDPIEYADIVWTDDGDPACKPCSESKEWQDFFTSVHESGNVVKLH